MGVQVTCNDHPEREYAQVSGNGENPTYMRVVIWSDLHRNMQQLVKPTGREVTSLTEHYVEDYISALLSKDTNKLKVYLGHEVFKVEFNGQSMLLRDDCSLRINGDLMPIGDVAVLHCKNVTEIFDFDPQYDNLEQLTVDLENHKFTITKVGNTSGYDGHCLRAYSYFPETLGHLPNTVAGINSIKKLHPDERQESKVPTFLLTYGGSWKGVQDKMGFAEDKSKRITNNYHLLYKESDEYKEKRLEEAAELGYMVLAFGLRIRCPLLNKTMRQSRSKAMGASEDERTLGNAMGQSYGQLNNRAMVAFMNKVWNSPYKYDIFPIAPIHDASYYIATNDVNVIQFINTHLIQEMQWQEDPLIAHDRVKIGAELDIAYPNWAYPVTIPNGASNEKITELCEAHLDYLDKEGVAYG